MNKAEIAALVVAVLKEVQETSGREWTKLEGDAAPIGALDGFDSLSGMEATTLIEQKLKDLTGLDSLGDESLFVTNDKALTLDEVCDKISAALPGGT